MVVNRNAYVHNRQSMAHYIMQLTFVQIYLRETKSLGKSYTAAIVLLFLDHKMHLLMMTCITRLNPMGGKELSYQLITQII